MSWRYNIMNDMEAEPTLQSMESLLKSNLQMTYSAQSNEQLQSAQSWLE
jgi:hypothetical protein